MSVYEEMVRSIVKQRDALLLEVAAIDAVLVHLNNLLQKQTTRQSTAVPSFDVVRPILNGIVSVLRETGHSVGFSEIQERMPHVSSEMLAHALGRGVQNGVIRCVGNAYTAGGE